MTHDHSPASEEPNPGRTTPPTPWSAEVHPTHEQITSALHTDFPALSLTSVVSAGEGWNSYFENFMDP